MEMIRTFIAIEIPGELKRQLAHLQGKLKTDNQPGIKWVNPDGIHLTLKFLGNIRENDISGITEVMIEATAQIPTFFLEPTTLGAFPDLKRIQVIWIGLGGEIDKLKHLQHVIENSLTKLGFKGDQRPFKPHLTLARLGKEVSLVERQRLGELITSNTLEMSGKIIVKSVNLIKSKLTRKGALYSRISSVGLLTETQIRHD
ncbi:MAG: RNA 2',3'-cyclic phosphodiesterase [Dehalococcoidia bacterium]|nr:MAG: RNA 2',3'-cyclic phosphodiesterase [Dehalococcoidia bacterium]